jgi:hypothetical protein
MSGVRPFGPLDPAQTNAMSELPGAVRVRIRWEPSWKQQITLGIERGMVGKGELTAEPKTEESWRVSGGATTVRLQPQDTIYRGPYAFSKDRERVAASVVSPSETRQARRVAVVDLKLNRIVGEVSGPESTEVHGVTWSPDGKYLALLLVKPERGSSDALSAVSGHPRQSATFMLLIVRNDLHQVAQVELARRLPHAVAEVVWN